MSLIHHALCGFMTFAVILSAFGAWDVPNAHGQEALRGAVVSLSFDRPSFKAGDDVMVRVGITNATGAPIRILRWFTPLDGFERSLFTVSRDGKPVPYVGKMVKRAAPTEKDYVTLMAGESLTSDADLSANYDLSVPGVYAVTYSVDSPQLFLGDVTGQLKDGCLSSAMLSIVITGRTSVAY